MDVCKVLAKSLVQSKRAKNRIHTSKAQINSVMMEIQNQHSMVPQLNKPRLIHAGMMRVAGCLQKSTVVMQAMSSLVRLPEIQATMAALSKEMMKVGWQPMHLEPIMYCGGLQPPLTSGRLA